jgi:alanine dehydrogenase
MRIGVLKEIKPEEYRVSLTAAGARELTSRGHDVFVEQGAGLGSNIRDEDFAASGVTIVPDAAAVFEEAKLLLKVKEPLREEYERLRPHHVLFTYLHLAPDTVLTQALVDSGAACVAYETVQNDNGRLPLLAPMSEIAGRLATQVSAQYLERTNGGKGKLIGGATGVEAARVLVMGAGVAGGNAAAIAVGMKAKVKVLDVNIDRLAELEMALPHVECLMSNQTTIEEQVAKADVLIGAVLVPGAKAPALVSEELVMAMEPGSVIVDLSVDQGGCVATSHMTTHTDPVYLRNGVVHYCVGNMAGVVPVTATVALTNSTLPYVMRVADLGLELAARSGAALARGINVYEGKVANAAVAEATGLPYVPIESLLPIDFG